MKKNTLLGIYLLCFVFLNSCSNDDDGYVPVAIEANADSGQLQQDATLEIDVLANDTGVPTQGTLTVQNGDHGSAQIIDPAGTPADPSDDLVHYAPDTSFYGGDSFTYTICDQSGTNCATATVTITVNGVSPVNYSVANIPYDTLSEYNFFEGALREQEPVFGVMPYKPISALFSDYAKKKRFIWMPESVEASYVNDYSILDMPVGTILIKTFYYDNVQPANDTRIIETRLMIKNEEGWIFAEYVWNDDQTEAYLDMNGSFTEVTWLQDGVEKYANYAIPAESACFTCHKSEVNSIPIGLKPQNLNGDYPYADGAENQLRKLVEFGYLSDNVPIDIETMVDYYDSSQPLNLRARSYVDINCAHCHSDDRHCDYRPMRFAFNETGDPENMGVCVDPETPIPPFTKIVDPNNTDNSVLFFRISSTAEEYRMPLLGRTINHEEGIALIQEWINSLTQTCD
ncbi:MAG: Ig-like domain-containing protein [Gilvibacter sp.]